MYKVIFGAIIIVTFICLIIVMAMFDIPDIAASNLGYLLWCNAAAIGLYVWNMGRRKMADNEEEF